MRALIFGVTGQDGCYLAEFLVRRGYEVFGTSRTFVRSNNKIKSEQFLSGVKIVKLNMYNYEDVSSLISQIQPNEIYNLAGQSSVGLSFAAPSETILSISQTTINVLDSIRRDSPNSRLFNAGSCEIFGRTDGVHSEKSFMLDPISPYAVGKTAAYYAVKNYRETYNLHVSTGILGNHDSRLRPKKFIVKKLLTAAHDIAHRRYDTLEVGDLNVVRDWGFAGEYIEGMWAMVNAINADDFIIATGHHMSLLQYARGIFDYFGLKCEDHLLISEKYKRVQEIQSIKLSNRKIHEALNWVPRKYGTSLIEHICDDYVKNVS